MPYALLWAQSAEKIFIIVIDLINQFGMYCDTIEDFEFNDDMIYINTISQQTNAGLIYRDDSGIEDNSANFVLRYDKN